MKTKYGIDLEVIDHKEKAYVKEIVLGKTNRGENIDTSKMILDEYEIKTIGEKVFIDGGLIGGASLVPAKFAAIVDAAQA